MHCPFCGASDTRVVDSRLSAEGDKVRRRRECPRCNARFTTYEIAELLMPPVAKRDGRREPFLEEKLRTGLKSCAPACCGRWKNARSAPGGSRKPCSGSRTAPAPAASGN